MDTPVLVNKEAGERLVAELVRAGVPVTAGYWLKPEDRGWRLYVASDWADEPDGGLRFVLALRAAVAAGRVDGSVSDAARLVAPRDRVVQAVLDQYRRYPQLFPCWYAGVSLGDVGIAAAYLYPPPATPAAA